MSKFCSDFVLVLFLMTCYIGRVAGNDPSDTTASGFSGNPLIRSLYTADPAALVYSDTFFIYTGHDEQAEATEGYVMHDWHVFSSVDLINWHDHGAVLNVTNFTWAQADAWAGQCIEKSGKFYWYVPMSHKTIPGFSIGVAVSDHPTGPFVDAKGSALITNDMTTNVTIHWDDIDPAVFINNDGQAYLYWGNRSCKWAKLKENMIEIDGPIHSIDLPTFTEAPWLHKRGDMYYLSYASGWPEYIDYAISDSPEGPWSYKDRLNEYVPNCSTNHQSIVEFRGEWYFVYHNGNLPAGGNFRRSVCLDKLYYNTDGSIQPIVQTIRGVPEKSEKNTME
jgi:beta-xylosidase